MVVVLLELEFEGVDAVVVFVVFVLVVSLVFSFTVEAGFTTVVLFSVFLSAGGVTVSVFCSQAPRSAALAKMQISFFIVWIECPSWDKVESKHRKFSALPKYNFNRQLRAVLLLPIRIVSSFPERADRTSHG